MFNISSGTLILKKFSCEPKQEIYSVIDIFEKRGGSVIKEYPKIETEIGYRKIFEIECDDFFITIVSENDLTVSLQVQSKQPEISDWSDINEETEQERTKLTEKLLGVEADLTVDDDLYSFRIARDPREGLVKAMIHYK